MTIDDRDNERTLHLTASRWRLYVVALHRAVMGLPMTAADQDLLIELRNSLVRRPNEYLGPETDARLAEVLREDWMPETHRHKTTMVRDGGQS